MILGAVEFPAIDMGNHVANHQLDAGLIGRAVLEHPPDPPAGTVEVLVVVESQFSRVVRRGLH